MAEQCQLLTLGQIVITPAALSKLEYISETPLRILARHQTGDWGAVCRHDIQANQEALEHGGRVFSIYDLRGVRFYVVTEADRSATTVMLPLEY